MESNEQNKLANKIETESQMQRTDRQLSEGRMVGELGEKGEGIKPKTKTKNPSNIAVS